VERRSANSASCSPRGEPIEPPTRDSAVRASRNRAEDLRRTWTIDEDAMLIAMADQPILVQTAALDRSYSMVTNRRTLLRKRGLLPTSTRRPWTIEDEAALLAMHDQPLREVARVLRRSLTAVSERRDQVREHPVPNSPAPPGNGVAIPDGRAWTVAEDALFASRRDLTAEGLAALLGRSVTDVVARRRMLARGKW
jgi:hypothetical protein